MGCGPHWRFQSLLLLLLLLLLLRFHVFSSLQLPPFHGIAPQDREYYVSEAIACIDGSKSFPRHRLNDDFCDCPDGTDEPGTSACPGGRFYCRNVGDVPRHLFSSRVNDLICDCCDGSDEYDGGIDCPNTCRKELPQGSRVVVGGTRRVNKIDLEDLVQNIKELKIVAVVEFLVAFALISCCLFHWRVRSKRKRLSFRNSLQYSMEFYTKF